MLGRKDGLTNGRTGYNDETSGYKDTATGCDGESHGGEETQKERADPMKLLYGVEDNPPVHLTILCGSQIALINVSFCITVSVILSGVFCLDAVLTSRLTCSTLFLSGVATIAQTTFGLRLPIFQGPNPTFLVPLLNMMVYPEWKCEPQLNGTSVTMWGVNTTVGEGNSEVVLSPHQRIQIATGSLALASLVHLLLGGSGLMGHVMKYIGPLTVSPTIIMIGVSLFKPALDLCETNWAVAAFTFLVFLILTAYVGDVPLPLPAWNRRQGCHRVYYPYLQIMAVLAALICGWLLCHVLTVTGSITDDPSLVEYTARTDAKIHVIKEADWFSFPYPGQFGSPSFSVSLFVGMLVCVLLSIVESLGDYIAVSQVCATPYPPSHALNRGVFIEGLSSVLSAFFGVGHGSTSYSEMISIIGLTKVASRRVFMVSGLVMVAMGLFSKVGALLVCIPPPVLGGKMVLALGTLVGMGLSVLQTVDLSKTRNYITIGLSLFLSIALPEWIIDNPIKIQTGYLELDHTLLALFGNPIFIACLVGFIMDNTLPGKRSSFTHVEDDKTKGDKSVYDLPLIPRAWFQHGWSKFVPFLPYYQKTLSTNEEVKLNGAKSNC